MAIRRADLSRPLTLAADRLTWAGPSDPEPDAPLLACELPVTGFDAGEIATLVARTAIPSTLLRELAERCPPGDDDPGADPRWRRARAAAAIARGAEAAAIEVGHGRLIEGGVDAVRRLSDGTLVRIRGAQLAIGDAMPIELPAGPRTYYQLLAPLAPSAFDPAHVAVFVMADRSTLLVFGRDGTPVDRVEAPASGWCTHVSHGRAGYWVHDDYRHVRIGDELVIEQRPRTREHEHVAGRWLLAIDREVAWISLDTGERRAFPWGRELRALVREGDRHWCTTPEGIWHLDVGASPALAWDGDACGLAIDGAVAYVGPHGAREVLALDLATGAIRWRAELAHYAWRIERLAGVIVAAESCRFTLLTPEGRELATAADERRDIGVARLADGTVAASCGEQVVIVVPDGSVRRTLPMPYDGQIVGATADRFVFGPVSGGVDRVAPTALVAFDRTGRVTSQLGPPHRPACITDTEVLVLDHGTHELRSWDPRGTARGVTPPPARRPSERGRHHVGYEVINPRDDWPEIGIEVRDDLLALDGTYGGSSGRATEVALRVSDGAIATFARCDFTIGADGTIAERGATVLLIDCKLPAGMWSIGTGCHLAIVGGTLAGDLRIHAAPTASVSVDGLVVRRGGDVYLITEHARGDHVVVDGRTYHWESDERSGASYLNRGKQFVFVHVVRDDGAAITFARPDANPRAPSWWRGRVEIDGEMIARAVRIAAREGLAQLTAGQVFEAIDGSVRTIADELIAARGALDDLAAADPAPARATLLRALLAVGCSGTTADREAIDDWVASHSNALVGARAGIQRILDDMRGLGDLLAERSAIAFLLEMCARVNVELALDPTRVDAWLTANSGHREAAWGIPTSHWWWKHPSQPSAATAPDDDQGPWR